MARYISRLLSDYEEKSFIGERGYGCVVGARNNMDGRDYAIKKISLGESNDFDYAIR
mgnify:CR=1 FL=1